MAQPTPYRDERPALPPKLATLRARLAEIDAEPSRSRGASPPSSSPRTSEKPRIALRANDFASFPQEIESTEGLLGALTSPAKPRRGPWLCCTLAEAATVLGLLVAIAYHPMPFAAEARRQQTTRTRAEVLRVAAADDRSRSARHRCPSIGELVRAGFLPAWVQTVDAWGRPLEIECFADDVHIVVRGRGSGDAPHRVVVLASAK